MSDWIICVSCCCLSYTSYRCWESCRRQRRTIADWRTSNGSARFASLHPTLGLRFCPIRNWIDIQSRMIPTKADNASTVGHLYRCRHSAGRHAVSFRMCWWWRVDGTCLYPNVCTVERKTHLLMGHGGPECGRIARWPCPIHERFRHQNLFFFSMQQMKKDFCYHTYNLRDRVSRDLFSSPLSKWQPSIDTLRHVTAFSWPTNIFLDAVSSTICSTPRGGSNKSIL